MRKKTPSTFEMKAQLDHGDTQQIRTITEPIMLMSDLVARQIVLLPGAGIILNGHNVIGEIVGMLGVVGDGEHIAILGMPK
jgi:hypothetical protein